MKKCEINLNSVYTSLLEEYNYQGWWPFLNYNGVNPTKTGSIQGYHPGNYDFPQNETQKIEIIMGCVLAQNVAWPNVVLALKNLNRKINFSIDSILNLAYSDEKYFKELIKPAGYYNQKYNYLINVLEFYKSLDNQIPSRKEILSVKGIGNETADSILLFAYKQKEFIIDTYLKRIFIHLNFINENDDYMKIKNYFEINFKGSVNDYQEFHSLIDEHAKNYYIKKPYGLNDKILEQYKK
ncbi:MAG: endonuclease III domain-containing protein [Methanobacteriaceae archaeon]|nr:endonuclease III domain-containing protein [Methanobacteriaceae archaeon]